MLAAGWQPGCQVAAAAAAASAAAAAAAAPAAATATVETRRCAWAVAWLAPMSDVSLGAGHCPTPTLQLPAEGGREWLQIAKETEGHGDLFLGRDDHGRYQLRVGAGARAKIRRERYDCRMDAAVAVREERGCEQLCVSMAQLEAAFGGLGIEEYSATDHRDHECANISMHLEAVEDGLAVALNMRLELKDYTDTLEDGAAHMRELIEAKHVAGNELLPVVMEGLLLTPRPGQYASHISSTLQELSRQRDAARAYLQQSMATNLGSMDDAGMDGVLDGMSDLTLERLASRLGNHRCCTAMPLASRPASELAPGPLAATAAAAAATATTAAAGLDGEEENVAVVGSDWRFLPPVMRAFLGGTIRVKAEQRTRACNAAGMLLTKAALPNSASPEAKQFSRALKVISGQSSRTVDFVARRLCCGTTNSAVSAAVIADAKRALGENLGLLDEDVAKMIRAQTTLATAMRRSAAAGKLRKLSQPDSVHSFDNASVSTGQGMYSPTTTRADSKKTMPVRAEKATLVREEGEVAKGGPRKHHLRSPAPAVSAAHLMPPKSLLKKLKVGFTAAVLARRTQATAGADPVGQRAMLDTQTLSPLYESDLARIEKSSVKTEEIKLNAAIRNGTCLDAAGTKKSSASKELKISYIRNPKGSGAPNAAAAKDCLMPDLEETLQSPQLTFRVPLASAELRKVGSPGEYEVKEILGCPHLFNPNTEGRIGELLECARLEHNVGPAADQNKFLAVSVDGTIAHTILKMQQKDSAKWNDIMVTDALFRETRPPPPPRAPPSHY